VVTLMLATSMALASSQPLESQNRIHAGLSVVTGPSPLGVTAGFDSRLTRVLALDVAAFLTPVEIAEGLEQEKADKRDYLFLRHGIVLTPGIRIPHVQPKAFAYDVFVRAGGGVVWVANLSPEIQVLDSTPYAVDAHVGGTGGLEGMLRFGQFGVRVGGRAWVYAVAFDEDARQYVKVEGQGLVEALVQF
jgi:hypothetical protein